MDAPGRVPWLKQSAVVGPVARYFHRPTQPPSPPPYPPTACPSPLPLGSTSATYSPAHTGASQAPTGPPPLSTAASASQNQAIGNQLQPREPGGKIPHAFGSHQPCFFRNRDRLAVGTLIGFARNTHLARDWTHGSAPGPARSAPPAWNSLTRSGRPQRRAQLLGVLNGNSSCRSSRAS